MTSRFPKRNSSVSVLAELSQLRDELRIKLHLAGLEVRAQWESVEPKLLGLERSLEQQGEGALEAAGELAVELVKAFRDFSVRGQEGGPSKAPVHDIMRVRIYTCGLDDTLHRAAQIMWEKDCGCLPVVDAARHVHAVITDRDVCMAALTQGVALAATQVSTAMSRALYTCSPDDSVGAVAELMRERQIRRVPVVDAAGLLIGMISLGDIARYLRPRSAQASASAAEFVTTLAAISEPRARPSTPPPAV
ncbi:MAG TPA: CBS domain-containing protein [Polyangiaceae bacterium]|jgi:CBS domain-containing protein|nr:CBS domain-containing protein [Polyangiaceae bacterium]